MSEPTTPSTAEPSLSIEEAKAQLPPVLSEGAAAAFTPLDVNSDGLVDFKDGVYARHMVRSLDPSTEPEDLDALSGQYEHLSVNIKEFQALVAAKVAEAVPSFDTNHDKVLSASEILQATERFASRVANEEGPHSKLLTQKLEEGGTITTQDMANIFADALASPTIPGAKPTERER